MEALILAAGEGKRMGLNYPKSLLEIGNTYILERLIGQFRKFGIERITLVTGFRKEVIYEKLSRIEITAIFNPFYKISDNMASFWFGAGEIEGDCIVTHADIIAEDYLIATVIDAKGDIVLPIDKSSMNAESMKFRIEDAKIVDIGKAIPLEKTSGESVPLMKFSRKALKALHELSGEFIEKEKYDSLLEEPLLSVIKSAEFSVNLIDVSGKKWIEIDDPVDYETAKKMFE